MKLTNEFDPVREWATYVKIFENGTFEGQMKKLAEEFDEVCVEEMKGNYEKLCEELGDLFMCSVNLCHFKGVKFEDVINKTYEKINARRDKGAMIAGTFVKHPHPTCNPSCFSRCTSNHQHEPKCKNK